MPGLSGFQHTYWGFPPLQAWAVGALVYLVGVAVLARSGDPARTGVLLGFPSTSDGDLTADTTEAGANEPVLGAVASVSSLDSV